MILAWGREGRRATYEKHTRRGWVIATSAELPRCFRSWRILILFWLVCSGGVSRLVSCGNFVLGPLTLRTRRVVNLGNYIVFLGASGIVATPQARLKQAKDTLIALFTLRRRVVVCVANSRERGDCLLRRKSDDSRSSWRFKSKGGLLLGNGYSSDDQ